MKSVLVSIRPKWCEKIASGRKTMELRKSFPKLKTPFKVYIYCTNRRGEALWKYRGSYYYDTQFPDERPNTANGKVIGEFVCDYILHGCHMANADIAEAQSCVRREDIFQYSNGEKVYGWHISNLVIYDTPKELTEFYKADTLNALDFEYQLYNGRQTYAEYLFTKVIRKPPQNWCYVEE